MIDKINSVLLKFKVPFLLLLVLFELLIPLSNGVQEVLFCIEIVFAVCIIIVSFTLRNRVQLKLINAFVLLCPLIGIALMMGSLRNYVSGEQIFFIEKLLNKREGAGIMEDYLTALLFILSPLLYVIICKLRVLKILSRQ